MSNNCDDDNANLLLLGPDFFFFLYPFGSLWPSLKSSKTQKKKKKKRCILSNRQHKCNPGYLCTNSKLPTWKHEIHPLSSFTQMKACFEIFWFNWNVKSTIKIYNFDIVFCVSSTQVYLFLNLWLWH